MKVLVFGSLNLDYVYSVDHFVTEGETLLSDSLSINLGGKGYNQAVALSRAGVPNLYIAGNVGDDGLVFYDSCKEMGINTKFLKTVTGPSGHAIIQLNKAGENCIIVHGGANQKNSKEYIDSVLNEFSEGDILFLQNEINNLSYIIDKAFVRGMKIVFNPSPFNDSIFENDLGKISVFFMNEKEGRMLTAEQTSSGIVTAMDKNYPNATVILTLGASGAIYHSRTEELYQPSLLVEVVDSTAAGDTYEGYFMSGMMKKLPVKEALEIATKASAMCVMQKGAATSIPFLSEVSLKVFTCK